MSSEQKVVLYGNGLFEGGDACGPSSPPTSPPATQYDAIRTSGFNTVILWTLHVHSDGSLYYNDDPLFDTTSPPSSPPALNPALAALPEQIAELKSGGTVARVLFSIGSGGWASHPQPPPDWVDLQALLQNGQWATVEQNFETLFALLPIDGIDFDFENTPPGPFTDLIVQLTLTLNQLGANTVTYCPPYGGSDNVSFWIDCLRQVCSQNGGVQIVNWLNLQTYGSADPSEFYDALSAASPPDSLGIADLDTFLVPGYWASYDGGGYNAGNCPSALQQTLSTLGVPVGGAFIWNSGEVCQNVSSTTLCPGETLSFAAYADAIIAGTQPQSPPG